MPNREPFPIPSELTPDTFCLCLQIPNNDDWKQVFNGLLAQPTYWFNWQRDPEHSGKELAAYWTELYRQIDWSTMSCCCDNPPAIFRYDTDGTYQRSTDGGVTWEDAPGYDYRNTSTLFPPPSAIGISNTKCQAADGVVFTINNEIVQALNDTFAAAQILALIAAVLLAILSAGSLAALTPLITAIGSAILDVGVTATQAAFTSDVWDRLRCNIFNHMTTDDATDASGFSAILSQINTDETGIVATVLYGIINAAGLIGINNMIRSNKGDPDADCASCAGGCLGDWDFYDGTSGTTVTHTDGEWVITSSIRGDGLSYVIIQGVSDTDCCTLGSASSDLGGGFSYYNPCGEDRGDIVMGLHPGDVTGHDANAFLFKNSAPFTATITSA